MKQNLTTIYKHYNTPEVIGIIDISKLIGAVPIDMSKTCAIFDGGVKIVYNLTIKEFDEIVRMKNG